MCGEPPAPHAGGDGTRKKPSGAPSHRPRDPDGNSAFLQSGRGSHDRTATLSVTASVPIGTLGLVS